MDSKISTNWVTASRRRSVCGCSAYRYQLHVYVFITLMRSTSTHYSWTNKNFYQRGDDWLIVTRWEQLIAMRDQLTFVEMVTWYAHYPVLYALRSVMHRRNDWGESDSSVPLICFQKAYINKRPVSDHLVEASLTVSNPHVSACHHC